MNDIHHKRLPDWESFDEITMRVVPRYKTSDLSGDEWRQHVEIEFKHKGELVASKGARDMNAAAMVLGHHLLELTCPIPARVIELDRQKCDQPSCTADAVGRYLLKSEFSSSGEKLDASDRYFHHYRQFCARHARRGDCSREDCDANYEPLDKLTPESSTNLKESPSVFAGAVCVDLDDAGNQADA